MDVQAQLLAHAVANDCTDPDCELHNPVVGVMETVVSRGDLAFYYAGAMAMYDLMVEASRTGFESAAAELRDQLNLNGGIGEDQEDQG